MTLLNSQFDVISHDPHKNALAGLMTVLEVKDAPGTYSSLPASGTPIPGDIAAGTIVVIENVQGKGKAVVADTDTGKHVGVQMFWTAIDGDMDYDGAFVHKITCLQGGGELQLDTKNFVTATYAPGEFLTCGADTAKGKFTKATTGKQIYGMVGQDGQDTSKGTLHVIIPQGISPLVPA
jgi:hypothetical protein